MKKIIILSLAICTLFITGCGCSKKDETKKTLTCSYKDEMLDDNFTINFENDIAVSFDSTKTYYFTSEEDAVSESALFVDFDYVEVISNQLVVKKHYDYEEDEQLTYDEALQMYVTYDCK